MPRGDGTGPMGMGPMTGRAMGYCAGYSTPGYMNSGAGFGRGMAWGRGGGCGLGMGRGFRGGFGAGWAPNPYYGAPVAPYGPAAPADEAAVLKTQLEGLEQSINAVKQRLGEIEGEAEEQK